MTFPVVYEGPPGIVHGGFLAVFFDCVLQQLNCDMGRAGKTRDLSLRYRRPTPILTELRVHGRAHASPTMRSNSTAELRLDGTVMCTAEMSAVLGDRAALPAVSPRRRHEHGRLRTVGEVLHAQVRERGDADFVVTETERLTYAAADERSRATRPRAGRRRASARASGSRSCCPTRHPVHRRPGWRSCAIGAVAVPISTFSKADELPRRPRPRRRRHADRHHHLPGQRLRRRPARRVRPRPLGAGPGARHPPCRRCGACISTATRRGGSCAAHSPRRCRRALGREIPSTTTCSTPSRPTSSPADRMVIVHTSGSTSAPKGVIHDHGPLVRHLEHLNGLRGLARGHALLLDVADVLDRRSRVQPPRRARRRRDAARARRPTDAPRRSTSSSASAPRWSTGTRSRSRSLLADPTFATRDFSSIRAGNLYPMLPEALRPRDPELRHNMLGMTEAGSVCLAEPGRVGPARASPRLVRPSRCPSSRRGSSTPRPLAECATGERGELWLRGPLLMEGYYGRERWTTFTPDEWYRTGDLFHRDDDGFFYFAGRARRHDQDRRRQRVAPRGRGRAARRHRRARADRGRRPRPRARRDRRRGGRRRRRRPARPRRRARAAAARGSPRTRCRATHRAARA